MAQAAAGVGVPRGGSDSFSYHTGFAGDSWRCRALPGKAQAHPSMPQLMGIPGGHLLYLEPTQVKAG